MFTNSKNTNAYYAELAKRHHMHFILLQFSQIQPDLLEIKNSQEYLKLQAIPVAETHTEITIATADPSQKNIEKIHALWPNKKIKIVVASRQNISQLLAQRFEKEFAYTSSHLRYDMDPIHSASYTFSRAEKIIIIVMLLILLSGLIWNFVVTLFLVSLFLSMGTVIIMSYKMGLTIRLYRFPRKRTPDEARKATDLPIYTILIPLLREKEITITYLLEALSHLDYPSEKLDIKFLLEKDDLQTLEILNKFDLPWHYDIVIVPPGLPLSKPRACNFGLQLSFGEFLTIYDAEDKPDAGQLRRVLQCFRENEDNIACVQAPLNFYNYKENLITRLFTIEYTHWFDSFVPALSFLNAPVPLGGTSNHFKIQKLRELGAWDPYIGTEDADIGIRIYRFGYKTNTVLSTTYEEANTKFYNWFRQRSRWNKGYVQTYLVNMRDPIRMVQQIGGLRFIHFNLFVGGNVFLQLANLPLWIFFFVGFVFYMLGFMHTHFQYLYLITWYNFFVGNLILMISEFAATYRRRLYSLLPYVPLKIFYWFVMSFAGYYAIYELLVRPGYWYKTEHGISKQGKDTDVKS